MDLTFGGEERRHFRETIEPLRDHTGKIVGVIGATTDITDQQRTQRQLTEELRVSRADDGDHRPRPAQPAAHGDHGGRPAAARADDAADGARAPAAAAPRRRTHAGDDRHAARLHARAVPGEGPHHARAVRAGRDLARRDRRDARRLARQRDRAGGARRYPRRVGSGAHDADDLEPGDQRHLVRRERHRRGRLDRGQRAATSR